MLVAPTLLALSLASVPQQPVAGADELADARSLVDAKGIGQYISVAPDGARVGGVELDAKRAIVIDAESGDLLAVPHAGDVHALALGSQAQGLWLGLADGRVVHVARDGSERAFEVIDGRPVDGVMVRADLLAWSSSAADRGGILDTRTGKSLVTRDVTLGGYRQPRMLLTRDARLFACLLRDAQRGGRMNVAVCDARTGEQVATMPAYVSHRQRCFVGGVDKLYAARRVANKAWSLQQLDLVTFEITTLDEELRGGHFVDLMLAPSERFLLEGDFEHPGAVLYDVTKPASRRVLGEKGVLPVGFLCVCGSRPELALTTGERRRGLQAWSTTGGDVVVPAVAALADKQVRQAGSLRRGRGMWVRWSQSKAGVSVGYLEVFAVRKP